MDFRPRIARGMEWLDATRPGWENRINLDRLDVGCPCKCILGQEFDLLGIEHDTTGYTYAHKHYDLNRYQRESFGEHGYALYGEMGYTNLTRQWKEAILARQQQVAIANESLEQEKPQHQLATAG